MLIDSQCTSQCTISKNLQDVKSRKQVQKQKGFIYTKEIRSFVRKKSLDETRADMVEVVQSFTKVTYLVVTTLQKLVIEVLQPACGSSMQGNSSSIVRPSGKFWQKQVM